jgi:hypothetical protein
MPIQTVGRRGPTVSASGRPNRYAPFLVVRLSDDRRRSFVVSAIETRASAGVRVLLGVIGAHLGWLGVDLAVAFGCGVSEEVGDVVGEASVEAAWSRGLLLHLQMLRRGRRWRRLSSNLGQEKCSVRLAEDLGSQRGRGERPVGSHVTATFSLLPRLR